MGKKNPEVFEREFELSEIDKRNFKLELENILSAQYKSGVFQLWRDWSSEEFYLMAQ